MADTEDDPWATLRAANKNAPEAGQFAYEDNPPPAAVVSPWQWIKLWLVVDVWGWFKKQLPLASKTLDSTYYLGYTRTEKGARNAVKKVVGREVQPQQSRIPIVIGGRRIGVYGTMLAALTVCVIIYFVRVVFGV
jgi:hypothetical protein